MRLAALKKWQRPQRGLARQGLCNHRSGEPYSTLVPDVIAVHCTGKREREMDPSRVTSFDNVLVEWRPPGSCPSRADGLQCAFCHNSGSARRFRPAVSCLRGCAQQVIGQRHFTSSSTTVDMLQTLADKWRSPRCAIRPDEAIAKKYAAGLKIRCPGGVMIFQRWALNSRWAVA